MSWKTGRSWPAVKIRTETLTSSRRELSWKVLGESLRQTMQTCGMLLWLSFGATAMIGVYNLAGGPGFIRELFVDLERPTNLVQHRSLESHLFQLLKSHCNCSAWSGG